MKNKFIKTMFGGILLVICGIAIYSMQRHESGYTEDSSTIFSRVNASKELTSLFNSKCYYIYRRDIFGDIYIRVYGKIGSKAMEHVKAYNKFQKYSITGMEFVRNSSDVPPEWLGQLGIKKQGAHDYLLFADNGDNIIVITGVENGIYQQFTVSETTGGYVGIIYSSNIRK